MPIYVNGRLVGGGTPGPPGPAGPSVWPTGYMNGFPMYNNSVNPDSQIDIESGVCRSNDDTINLVLTSTLTVDSSVSGVNGLDTGTVAIWTWYFIYLIYNPTSLAYASLLSTSTTSPTLPSGYTQYRRLGSVITDGSGNFKKFRCQYRLGNERVFMYNDTTENDVQILSAGSAIVWTDIYAGASIPLTSLLGIFVFRFSALNYDWKAFIRPGDASEDSPVTTVYAGAATISDLATSSLAFELRTSSTRYIQYKIASAGGELSAWVMGYVDFV